MGQDLKMTPFWPDLAKMAKMTHFWSKTGPLFGPLLNKTENVSIVLLTRARAHTLLWGFMTS